MGSVTALQFADEGASVVILDIQKQAGEEVVRQIEEKGGTAMFIETDVSSADQVNAAFDLIAKKIGPYEVLFNHAGTITVKPLDESTEEDYDRLMDINVNSTFLVCRRAVKEMSDNGGGSIVITASIASELGYPLESLYCMTKGAVCNYPGLLLRNIVIGAFAATLFVQASSKPRTAFAKLTSWTPPDRLGKKAHWPKLRDAFANPKKSQQRFYFWPRTKPASLQEMLYMSTTAGTPKASPNQY